MHGVNTTNIYEKLDYIMHNIIMIDSSGFTNSPFKPFNILVVQSLEPLFVDCKRMNYCRKVLCSWYNHRWFLRAFLSTCNVIIAWSCLSQLHVEWANLPTKYCHYFALLIWARNHCSCLSWSEHSIFRVSWLIFVLLKQFHSGMNHSSS